MKSPNNGEERTPNETSNNRNRLHLIDLLVKESHVNPQTRQAVAKAIVCSLQTDVNALLPKKNTYLCNSLSMEKSNLCLPRD